MLKSQKQGTEVFVMSPPSEANTSHFEIQPKLTFVLSPNGPNLPLWLCDPPRTAMNEPAIPNKWP
jgi:hypothetical protein